MASLLAQEAWLPGTHMGWAGGWMMIAMTVFWLGLLGALVWIAARAVPTERRSAPPPEELLASRFARGEIDADEYYERLDVLRR